MVLDRLYNAWPCNLAQNSRDGQQYRPAFEGVLPTARIIAEEKLNAAASEIEIDLLAVVVLLFVIPDTR